MAMEFKDTEKEDRHQRIKETWEQKQQGRSAKAKEIRDNFIKGPAPPTPPVVYGPKSLKPIDPWLVSYPLTWPIEKKRAEDTHKSILEALESHGTELRVFKELDFQLRQLHRQHTLKDIEDQIVKIATLMAKEQEAALEASAAAAAAAAQAVAVQDESKEKKKKR
ncbi:hypothetical protein HMI55_002358 [Coelomomyces lativittatus]|nr:hypothetical protein HMI55_002358 [Coelomomyces lativittatus]